MDLLLNLLLYFSMFITKNALGHSYYHVYYYSIFTVIRRCNWIIILHNSGELVTQVNWFFKLNKSKPNNSPQFYIRIHKKVVYCTNVPWCRLNDRSITPWRDCAQDFELSLGPA